MPCRFSLAPQLRVFRCRQGRPVPLPSHRCLARWTVVPHVRDFRAFALPQLPIPRVSCRYASCADASPSPAMCGKLFDWDLASSCVRLLTGHAKRLATQRQRSERRPLKKAQIFSDSTCSSCPMTRPPPYRGLPIISLRMTPAACFCKAVHIPNLPRNVHRNGTGRQVLCPSERLDRPRVETTSAANAGPHRCARNRRDSFQPIMACLLSSLGH
jgi:hypothetical protein